MLGGELQVWQKMVEWYRLVSFTLGARNGATHTRLRDIIQNLYNIPDSSKNKRMKKIVCPVIRNLRSSHTFTSILKNAENQNETVKAEQFWGNGEVERVIQALPHSAMMKRWTIEVQYQNFNYTDRTDLDDKLAGGQFPSQSQFIGDNAS